MNIVQSRPTPTIEARRLPVLELRPGSLVTLAKDSPTSGILPRVVGECAGGNVATVIEVTPFGIGKLRVLTKHSRARHPSGGQVFIVPGDQTVIVRMPETVPVPFTPVCTVIE